MMRMKIWTVPNCEFSFQADPAKNLQAFGKHGVTLRKGSEIFINGQPRIERLDYKDNHTEPRRVATGFVRNKDGHLGAVTAAFTKDGKNIRMITAQPATNAERNALRFAVRIVKNKHLLRGEIKKDLGRRTERQLGKKTYKTPKSAVKTAREQSSKKYSTYVKKGIDAAQKLADPAIQEKMREIKQQNPKKWAEKEKQAVERMRGKINRDFKDGGRSGKSEQYRIVEKDSPWKEKNREP